MSLLKQIEAGEPGEERDTLVLQAVCEAQKLKLRAGFRCIARLEGLRGFIELPGSGQVSWPVTPYRGSWDPVDRESRRRRVQHWTKAGSDE